MQRNAIIAIVAAIVVVAAAGAVGIYMMTNDNGDSSETYYFYISSDKTDIKGWHSGSGHNAAEGFADAMKKDNIEFTVSEKGYISKIGSVEGFVYSTMYLYNNTSTEAANGSIVNYGTLNGWKDIAGYDKTGYTGDKVAEMNGHIFFYAFYDASYNHATPDTDKGWMTTGPFEKNIKVDDKKQTYYFYLSTADSTKGWHSGSGHNAAEGFADAMKKDDIAYTVNKYGYIGKIGDTEGSFYTAQYVYTDCTAEAASGSIVKYGTLNGWNDIAGYDVDGDSSFKLGEFEANVYFISVYGPAPTYSHTTPDTDKGWMTTGPFSS